MDALPLLDALVPIPPPPPPPRKPMSTVANCVSAAPHPDVKVKVIAYHAFPLAGTDQLCVEAERQFCQEIFSSTDFRDSDFDAVDNTVVVSDCDHTVVIGNESYQCLPGDGAAIQIGRFGRSHGNHIEIPSVPSFPRYACRLIRKSNGKVTVKAAGFALDPATGIKSIFLPEKSTRLAGGLDFSTSNPIYYYPNAELPRSRSHQVDLCADTRMIVSTQGALYSQTGELSQARFSVERCDMFLCGRVAIYVCVE